MGPAAAIGAQPPQEVLLAVDTAAAALSELSAGSVELRVQVGRGRHVWIELSRAGRPAGELGASRALDLLASGAVGDLLAEGRCGSSRPR